MNSVMATGPRRSRRLRGLAPEESRLQQVCFICQRNLDIGSLSRCCRTSCCRVLMHRTCHREMVTRVRNCGNCRRENAEFTEVVLETDEEMEGEDEDNPFEIQGTNALERMRNELRLYRDQNRHFHTHSPNTYLWPSLPFIIDPHVWYRCNAMLEAFVTLFRGRPMYVPGQVMLPVPVTAETRSVLYRLFVFNTPYNLYDLIQIQRFRLFFIYVEEQANVEVQRFRLLPFSGGPSLYLEDGLWT